MLCQPSCRRATLPVLAALTLAFAYTPAHAAECTEVEDVLVRAKGTPTPDTAAFDVANPSGQFVLRIQNGPSGYDRVSAADVWLNGALVFTEDQLNQQVEWLEATIADPPAHNVLVGLLRSAPGSAFGFSFVREDATPPTVAVVSPANGTVTGDNTPLIRVEYSDLGCRVDLATVQILVSGTDRTSQFTLDSAAAEWQVPEAMALPEGAHTVMAQVADRAGNAATAQSTFTVDTTRPAVSITAPVNDAWYRTENVPALAYTVTDNLDPSPTATATGWSAAEGVHTVTVTATDWAGNVGTASVTYTVDNTPPVITVDAPAAGAWYTRASLPTPSATATDNLHPQRHGCGREHWDCLSDCHTRHTASARDYHVSCRRRCDGPHPNQRCVDR